MGSGSSRSHSCLRSPSEDSREFVARLPDLGEGSKHAGGDISLSPPIRMGSGLSRSHSYLRSTSENSREFVTENPHRDRRSTEGFAGTVSGVSERAFLSVVPMVKRSADLIISTNKNGIGFISIPFLFEITE